jgi:general secretion pathway protein K
MIKRTTGSILIVTLWILTILLVFTLGFARRVKMELKLSAMLKDKIESAQITKASVRKAIAVLKSDDSFCDTLNDVWSNNPDMFKGITINRGEFTIFYSREDNQEEEICYGLIDEERKININTASLEVLMSFEEIDEAIASAIIDWRDSDDTPLTEGAENSYYQSLADPYSCKNGPFQTKDELILVKGVTPELLTKLKEELTVYGEGKVNINTCSIKTLKVLGLNDNLSQLIVDYRKGSDGKEGTEDDKFFKKVNEIKDTLEGIYSISEEDLLQIDKLTSQDLITVKSKYFQACMEIKMDGNSEIIQKVEATIDREKGHIIYWHEE